MKQKVQLAIAIGVLLLRIESLSAAEFQPLGKAVGSALGATVGVQKSTVIVDGKPQAYFFTKDAAGKPQQLAFVQKRIYPPNCTHTWVVGVGAKSKKIEKIEVVEMSCSHAFPTKTESFLSQFMGKGPLEAKTLEGSVNTVAKATGTSNLAASAVVASIRAAVEIGK